MKKGAALLIHSPKAKKAVKVYESHDKIFYTAAHGVLVWAN